MRRSRLIFRLIALALAVVTAALVPALWVSASYQNGIYDDPSRVPAAPVAIVFGAGVQPDGSPTWMLADRVDAAVTLFKSGKVDRLLMTGDNSRADYDEVTAMKRRAVNVTHPLPRYLGDPVDLELQNAR